VWGSTAHPSSTSLPLARQGWGGEGEEKEKEEDQGEQGQVDEQGCDNQFQFVRQPFTGYSTQPVSLKNV